MEEGERLGCGSWGFVWGEEKGHVISRQVRVVWFSVFLSWSPFPFLLCLHLPPSWSSSALSSPIFSISSSLSSSMGGRWRVES